MARRSFSICLYMAVLAACSIQEEAQESGPEALALCASRVAAEVESEAAQVDLQVFRPLADEGDVSAQFALCALATSETEAMSLLMATADAGSAEAQFSLADLKRYAGDGGADLTEAARLYRLAAGQGHVEAQYRLAHMLQFGDGIPMDEAESVRWYRAAGENGHRTAQFLLGEMYGHRYRAPPEAIRWYRLAAEQGHPGAQFALASRFERGEGVPQNSILAHMWFNLARSQGAQGVPLVIPRLEDDMTRAQIAEAQAMATRCFNSGYEDCGW